MCLIYNSEEECTKIMSQFIQSGLSFGEMAPYFADYISKDKLNFINRNGIDLSDTKSSNYLNPKE